MDPYNQIIKKSFENYVYRQLKYKGHNWTIKAGKQMQRILVTGFSGFVSRHFLEFLDLNVKSNNIEVFGIDIHEPKNAKEYKNIKCSFENIDLLNIQDLKRVISTFKPDYVLHLASFSSVAFSWKNPVLSFQNNMDIFLNLVEALKEYGKKCRILSVGSSEEYGAVSNENIPISENCILNPHSPYAVARVSQEMLSKIYVEGFGLDIIMTRSFNHIGPYQDERFVISSFAKQLQNMKSAGITKGVMYTGNVEVIRDFVDVRDVVKAYYSLLLNGKKGDIYNICSGKGISLRNIIDKMSHILGIEVEIEIKKEFLRPVDNLIIIGSSKKIEEELNWKRDYSLEDSLEDILKY